MNEKILLCLNPGKTSFAFSFLSSTRGVLLTGYLNPVDSFNKEDLFPQTDIYRSQIEHLLDFKPDMVIAERYQQRTMGMGAVGEYVNFMLGVLAVCCRDRNTKLILINAGVWKKQIMGIYKHYDMEKHFKERWTVHECDSIGMGIFALETYGVVPKGTMVPLIAGKKKGRRKKRRPR